MPTKPSNQVPDDPNPPNPGRGFGQPDLSHGFNIFGDIADAVTGSSSAPESPDQAQLREGAQHFHDLSGTEWAKLTPEEKAQNIYSYINSSDTPVFSSQTFAGVKNEEKKALPPPTKQSQDQATTALEKQIAAGPWSQLGQALVKQYQEEETPTAAAVSGSTGPQAEKDAASQALASLGLSPSSGAGSWLSSQMGAANANAAPVQQAMAQEGAQYAAEATPISKALAAYGQSNELALATAPENAWLSALTSHVTSNLSYYGNIPSAAVSSIPAGVIEALQQSGGYPGAGGSQGGGLTPLSSLKVSNGQVTQAPSTAGAGSVSTGVIPGAGTNAGQ